MIYAEEKQANVTLAHQLLKRRWKDILLENGIIIAFVALFLFFSLISPYFLTKNNMLNVVRQVSMLAIVAIGMTFVIISAAIDLSVGSIMGITGVLIAGLLASGFPLGLSLLGGLGAALLIGFINGYFVSVQKVPAFIVTLGMMTAVRGLCLIYTGGYPIYISSTFFQKIGRGHLGSVPIPIIIMAVFAAVGHFILTQTKFGRYVFIVGGNESAALRFGINVTRVRIAVLMFVALASGISGIILGSRIASGAPTAGMGFELNAIAAVILGGTNLFGGEGTIRGTLVGVLIIGILSNGMTLLDVSPYYQELAKGLIIIFAVWLNTFRVRRK